MDDEPPRGAELFLDERGSVLRVRWDADEQRLFVSIWRDGACVATHSLDFAEMKRLSTLLTQSWVEGLGRSLHDIE